ncbi:phenolpthiocerol synthesis polyketide synthase ppsB [Lasiosphaeria miniovina]|uniref:Phenolpthiocerol synthesis polyketide synthase ppsB n=1 Tax=Lasiosphaeria miniovina TaxID=1954250 RepID=A0AA40B6S8_9PEZI|nr:phenolpthiocerol synthesis polyketide synthase ppsB [Lasiosphaeria miniovina]KAK0728741.1 phenolpthiocerol synthesis polyketide synthase ppsB [Lasiosphaeria miniovina]
MPSATMANDTPIAVVGLACRFPGDASTPSKFWDMLKEGRDAYSPTSSRWNSDAFYHPDKTRTNVIPTKGGHFLKEDPYVYDAAFFNITAAEAMALDPKQRIAMEVTYEALENANLGLQDVWGTQTTCYIGSAVSDYRDSVIRDFMQNPKYHLLGTGEEMISNRISHFLNIHGPSATVATACSSSLMATHLAVQSIKSGEADMAITGGVGLMLTPDFTTHLANLSFLNPAGQSRAFDESAGGYGRGEGCGIIVLKRLDKALADGDNIRAVIRATGANSDGYTQGVTMPSLEAQAALIRHVYESHGLDFSSTQYVEAHGTGTKAGDPIEAEAIYSTIGKGGSRKGKLWMGSLKPNIGHLEPAAGVASIIKSVLALEHGLIPPNIRFNKPNPAIPFDQWNMAVPTELTPWPVAHVKRASINGFGMGGTNGHVVLEAFNPSPTLLNRASHALAKPHSKTRLFTFSSHDQAGFKRNAAALVEHLDRLGPATSSPEYLANLARTLSGGRSRLSWKATCVADSTTELRDYLTTRAGEGASRDASSGEGKKRLGFVFTGQGAQWARMGIEMLDRPVFGASVAKSARFLGDMGCTWDPVAELLKSQQDGSRLSQPEISQPICSVLQIALVDELRAWGVTPSRVVGHSSGEIAAAYSIGALSHRDAIAAAYFRGQAATKLRAESPDLRLGMMAVGCSREDADALIAQRFEGGSGSSGRATVACVNSPSSVTLSGDVDSLEQLRAVLDERKVFARRLKVEMAYHSTHMNRVMDYYLSTIADIEPLPSPDDGDDDGDDDDDDDSDSESGHSSQGTMVSSVTGFEISPEALGPYYWVRNLVSPVLFSDAVKELVAPDDDGEDQEEGTTVDLLIEVGPHGALGGPVEQILSHHGIQGVGYESMLTRGKDARQTSLQLAAKLVLAGVPVDVAQVNGDGEVRTQVLTDLPPYQWNHAKAFKHETRIQRELMTRRFPSRSLLGAKSAMMDETQHVWRGFIRLADEPWIRGHTIGSTVLLPAAGMVSMALAAAQQLAEPEKTLRALRLREVSFFAAMALPEDAATEVITTLRPHLVATSGSSSAAWWEFTISSCVGVDQLRDNCRGLVALEYKESTSPQMARENALLEAARVADYRRIVAECPDVLAKADFYAQCARISWNYGELFQGVEKVHLGDGQTAYDVKLADIGETYSRGLERPFLVHGAALDAIIHGALGGTYRNGAFCQDKPLLPTYIGELDISLDMPDTVGYVLPTSCVSRKLGFNALSSDIVSFDGAVSRTFLSMTDFRLTELGNDDKQDDDRLEVDPAEITSEVRWNYALGVMEPAEIAAVVAKLAQGDRALLHMLIHDNPAATVIELASDSGALSQATVPRLPKGTILPSRVKYAVAAAVGADQDKSSLFGDVFSLGAADEPLPAEITAADVLVIPQSVGAADGLGTVLTSLVGLGKPDAAVILAADSVAAAAVLEAKGFYAVFAVEGAALYKQQPQQHANGVNGAAPSKREFVIIEPSAPSNAVASFSGALQNALEKEKSPKSVVSAAWPDLGIQSADEAEGKTFISLVELETPLLDDLSEPDFDKVKQLISNSERLLWITGTHNPSMAVVDGLSRTARNENASLKFQVLHLLSPPDASQQRGPSLAARLATADTKDDEFREHDGLPKVSRFYSSAAGDEAVRYCLEDSVRVQPLKSEDAPAEALRLTIGKPGLLDSLAFIHDERFDVPLGDMEIEVDVRATGVNFKDVMASMGLVEVSLIGHEASGTVVATGAEASGRFQVGDRVVVSGEGMHATRLRSDHRLAVKIPDAMSFEEAAVLPTVHATAYHALVNVAKLQPGQSVLIHAAAGGVGQAALQLARHLGLVTYVTVGSDDKRALVMDKYGVPAGHIFNSRDASFAKAVKRVTAGRGVDCVLNSLSGELLRASWECVAMFGTFVEIGLRDITDNMRLDMRPFIKCTTFAFINLTNFFDDHKDVASRILQDTFDLVHRGVLYAPSPLTAYPVGELEAAFRTMQRGKHRGKLALSYGDGAEAKVHRRARDALALDPAATYLIVGGLGGLGRSLAREFVACGARHVAFLSRSGADGSPEARQTVDELSAAAGGAVTVRALRGDVADEASFRAAMAQCERELPPVRGVVQMAMVLRDGVLEKMGHGDWAAGMRPKVQGTRNLDQYFGEDRPVDFFIACSSVSGVCGNAGQAQYAAGNTFQDALAQHRRARGLRAVAVNLGIMRDVGAIAESTGVVGNNLSQWEHVIGIREPAFHALVKSLILRQAAGSCPAQVCTGLGSADAIAAHGLPLPYYFTDPRLGPLAVTSVAAKQAAGGDGAAGAGGASLASRLAEAGGIDKAGEVILDALVRKIADMLQIPASEVDPGRPMYRYGVDSLVALEVRNWITKELKANMALLEILAAVPMAAFAVKIAEKSKLVAGSE